MTVEKLPDPVLITRPAALRKLADELARERVIAVDTESNSLYAYREQVCLIQFSIPRGDYLVDPLALQDLSPLAPIFSNPEIEKVFHAAEYDLLCLKRDFGFTVANLFDTMIAARILGREAFGLGAILEAEFGVQLDKRFQRANWGQRPLPPPLLAYARLDTHYLIALRDRLKAELHAQNLWPLAHEDFIRSTAVNGNGRSPEDRSVDCWRVSGSYDLEPQNAAVLLELCRYRDRVARSQNRPLFKVLSDQTLLEIANALPQSLEQLSQVQGMTRGQIERHGRELLDAVQRGLKAEPAFPPRSPRPNEDYLDRLEALRRWRKETALEMGVKSDVILPRDLLIALAENNPRHSAELERVLGEVPWRLERFGSQILDILSQS
jgi:ribonuclease D